MLYIKNADLAAAYHVSTRTVVNWIAAAKDGKLSLGLHEQDGKLYIANTTKNRTIIKQLVKERKKYRNTRGHKMVTPGSAFYELFNKNQIFDIISSIDIYREVPHKYSYFDEGARTWDKYAQRLATEPVPNMLTSSNKLIDINLGYLDDLLRSYKLVNIVDIGIGNCLPVRGLIEHLLNRGKLNRYVALDLSEEMLRIARRNIQQWFNNRVSFEGHPLDIDYDRFSHVLTREHMKDAKDTINLILFLGGTIENLRSPDDALGIIRDSMGPQDLFMHSEKLDTGLSRQYFEFNSKAGDASFSIHDRFLVDLLNIDPSFYAVEMGFNSERLERYIRLRLKVALTIKFKFDMGERLVTLDKDETILLMRYWHLKPLDVMNRFARNNFVTLQASQTEDREYILTVSRVSAGTGLMRS